MPVLTSIFMLGFVIFIHEFGHLLAAKRYGVPVKEFAIGFKLFGISLSLFKWGETTFTLNPIPLGGFVKFANANDLNFLPKRQQIAIALAGPLFNVTVAGILLSIVLGGTPSDLPMGIRIIAGPITAFVGTLVLIPLTLAALFGLFGWNSFGGPVTIATGYTQVWSDGLLEVLLYIALVNASIAALNLLPIYPLDGGHIARVLLKPIREKHQRLSKVLTIIQVMLILFLIHAIIRALIGDITLLFR